MNSYSLAADSHRWWWLPAITGAVGAAAVSAILVVPATGEVAPSPAAIGGAVLTGSVTEVERPCYLAPPEWNTPRGWEHPVCTTVLRGRGAGEVSGFGRPAPDHLP